MEKIIISIVFFSLALPIVLIGYSFLREKVIDIYYKCKQD